MKDPDLRIGDFLALDFARQPDGTIDVHMWEPMGSMHSEIGLTTTLTPEDEEKLKDYLNGGLTNGH